MCVSVQVPFYYFNVHAVIDFHFQFVGFFVPIFVEGLTYKKEFVYSVIDFSQTVFILS